MNHRTHRKLKSFLPKKHKSEWVSYHPLFPTLGKIKKQLKFIRANSLFITIGGREINFPEPVIPRHDIVCAVDLHVDSADLHKLMAILVNK